MKHRFLIEIICFLVISSHSLSAKSEDLDDLFDLSLEDLLKVQVTVASTKPETVLNSVSSVSVISREDINRYGFRSTKQALTSLAGIDVFRTYFKMSIPTSRGILQDHYANKVLVMINNVPTYNGTTGEAILERINIHDIERIEVLKGPASVLYGTNAYSGAINIVLRDAKTAENNVYLGLGNHQQRTAGISKTLVNPKLDSRFFISANFKNGEENNATYIDENDALAPVNDYIDNKNMTIQYHYKSHQFLFNAYEGSEGYMGVIPTIARGAGTKHLNEGILGHYQYRHDINERSSFSFATEYDWNYRSYSRDSSFNEQSEIGSYHTKNSLRYNTLAYQHYSIELGVEYDFRKNIDSAIFFEDDSAEGQEPNLKNKSTGDTSIFSQIGYEHKNWKGLIGTRLVDNDAFNKNLSNRGTIVYKTSETSSLKFIAAQSYRAPSIFELFIVAKNNILIGNTSLEPEKSNSYEFSYQNFMGRYFYQANIYYATYNNKIFRTRLDAAAPNNPDVIIPNVIVYDNGEEFDAYGFELETRYSYNNIDAFLNFDYVLGNNGDEAGDSDHYNFKYVPDFNISGGISKEFNKVLISSVANYRDETEGSEKDIDSNLSLDLFIGFSQQVNQLSFRHRVRIDNVTNENAHLAEYSRRKGVNEVPLDFGRVITYEVSSHF